jgi:F-type H+-transporting ATPase subunit epsilon
MASKKSFHCSVITPEGSVYDGPAEFVVIPAIDGQVGILRDRAPLLSILGPGELRIVAADGDRVWFVGSGFAQVLNNHIVVLTQQAVPPENIDRTMAEIQLQEARSIRPVDDEAARRKAEAEVAARARLRMVSR